MIELIIQDNQGNWRRLDLENLDIVLSKKLTDLSDPSKIACGYSLGVVLPITENNNDILGRLYGFDHVDGTTVTFSQKDKHSFKLLNNGEPLYEGNFVLDSISTSIEDGIHYDVTLYDEMSGIYQRLDYTLKEPAASADGGDDLRNIKSLHVPCTPTFVKEDWEGGTALTTILDANGECDITSAKHHSVVGLLPTEREWDNQEKDRFICDDVTQSGSTDPLIVSFKNQMKSSSYPTEYSSVGAMMWKVYQLKPYIYIKPLWEFIASEVKRVSGYSLNLGGSFFSTRNPYWTRGIYTAHYLTPGDSSYDAEIVRNKALTADIENGDHTIVHLYPTDKIDTSNLDNTKGAYIYTDIKTEILFKAMQSTDVRYSLSHDGYVTVRVDTNGYISGVATSIKNSQYFLVSADAPKLNEWMETLGEEYVIIVPTQSASVRNGQYVGVNDVRNHTVGTDVSPKLEYFNDIHVRHWIGQNEITPYDHIGTEITVRNNYTTVAEESVSGTFEAMRLYFEVETRAAQDEDVPVMTWRTLLGDDWNVQHEFCKLLKIFNLVAVPDSATKTIDILTRGDYYSDGRVVDWSGKIHAEETIESTDILTENNTLLYTYEDSGSPLNTASMENEGVTNNTHAVILPYANNEGSTTVIEGLHNSDILKEKTYWWGDCNQGTLQHRTATPYVYYDNKDDGSAMEERIGQLLFRNPDNLPLTDFEQFGRVPYPIISKDNQYEVDNEEYLYHMQLTAGSTNSVVPMAFPNFGYYSGQYGSEWEIGLYDTFHKNWNLLIYHEDNRMITAEFTLTYEEYRQFSFSNPVTIGNCIYLPLEIDEYALNNNRAKVKLLRIGDAGMLRNIDHYFGAQYLDITPSVAVTHSGTNTISAIVNSSTPWSLDTLTLPAWLTSATVSPSSGAAGVTQVTVTIVSNTNLDKAAEKAVKVTSTGGATAYLYAVNVAPYIAPHDTIAVTPMTQTVPNATGEDIRTVINVDCLGEWKYTLNAGYTVYTSAMVGSVMPGEWTDDKVLMLSNIFSLEGYAGDIQTITFTSRSGQTATFSWVRADSHMIWIEGGDTQSFEYTYEGSGKISTLEFQMRTRFPFVITDWVNNHMADDMTGEYCYDKSEGEPVLYVDGNPYAANEKFVGAEDTTYTLRWEYPRLVGSPSDPLSNFYWTVSCLNDTFIKIVRIVVTKQNNQ